MEYSFTRYLRAKVSVDDRALNQLVWEEMVKLLPEQSPSRPLRVLEIGCGIGTMLERMVGKGVFNQVDYTGIDLQAENTRLAEQGLQDWPTRAGFQLAEGERGINLLEDKDLFRKKGHHSFSSIFFIERERIAPSKPPSTKIIVIE